MVLAGKALVGSILICFGMALHAQEVTPEPEPAAKVQSAEVQPEIVPGQPIRTARLLRFSGDVQIQRTDNTGGDTAVLNMPLTQGTRIMTGDSGQAEIEFDDGSVARLTPQSALSIDSLADKVSAEAVRTQLTVLNGLVYFELRTLHSSDWGVQAGTASASPTSNCSMRVQVDQSVTTFSLISGAVQLDSLPANDASDGFNVSIREGESVKIDSSDPSRYFLNQQIEPQSWDTWNQSRDEHAADSAQTVTSARNAYAANQAYGWSDLDNNGTWYSAPPAAGEATQSDDAQDGGDLVWQPAAAADDGSDFDPYGDGAFVWSGGSYVWASGYAWGWTPYRCGRWEYYPGLGWVWRPNRFCLALGYGGYSGVFIGHRHPPRYRPVGVPVAKPGPVHPIVRVKSSTDRPAKPHDAVAAPGMKIARLDGRELVPLQPLERAPGDKLPAAQALYRDFPVDTKTQKPLLGSVDKTGHTTTEQGSTGWVLHQGTPGNSGDNAQPRTVRTRTGGSEVRPVQAPAPQRTEHAAAPASATHNAPAPSTPGKPK